MSDADEMTHDYAAAEMVADVMVAAVDSDQGDVDGEADSDRHDGDVAAVLFDSSNSI